MTKREDRTVRDCVKQSLAGSYKRLVENDSEVRDESNPEAVHQARVATRRLRSDLRTLEPWLDARRMADLRGELRWLGAELGAVRDLDVLRDRLLTHSARLPTVEAENAHRVIRRLQADREAARAELVDTIRQPRYLQLRLSLGDAARTPPVTKAARKQPATKLAGAVRKRWKKLQRAVSDLSSNPTDDALHRVRVKAKRVRYASEAAVPAFGKPARKFAAGVEAVQEVLGEHHDAVVASAWLAKTAHECTPAEAYAIGMLAQIERECADAAREAFPDAWRNASRKRLRRWM